MSKSTWWLIAAVCFLLAAVAGAISMAVNDGSWTLVVLPLAVSAAFISLWSRARKQ